MSTNILINSRSMNGIITISDGTATLENGDLVCDDVSCDDVNSSNIITNNITTNVLTCQGSFRSNIIGPYTIPTLTSSEYGSLISYGNTSGNGATDFTNFQSTYTSTKGGFNFWNKSTTQTLTNLGIIDNTQTYFKSQLIGCTAETPLNPTSIVNKSYVVDNFLDRVNNLAQNINGVKTFSNNCNFSGSLISNNLTADNITGTQNIYTTNTTGTINIGTGQTTGTINIGTATSFTNIKSILKIYDKSSPYTNTLEINQTAGIASYISFAGTTTASQHSFTAYNTANNPRTPLTITYENVSLLDLTIFTARIIRSSNQNSAGHEFFSNMGSGTLTMGSLTSNIINNSINTLNAQHTFNNSTPICSVATPTAVNHLTRKDYVDNNFMFKTGTVAENINGVKTFTNKVNFNGSPCLVATGNSEFAGANGYFIINPNMGSGTLNAASEPGTIGIVGLKDQINDKVLFTLYGTTHVSVKLSFTGVSMGFGGNGQQGNTSVTCDGTNIIIKPNIKFSGDNTIQSSAFTGAGSLSGTYNLSNITIDTNGKITSLSSGLSSVNIFTNTNTFNDIINSKTGLRLVDVTPSAKFVELSVLNNAMSFSPSFNNNSFEFITKNSTGSSTIIPVTINFNSTTFNNALICNYGATFNTTLPTSTVTPSNPSDLTTKAYVDGMPVHGILNSNNIWTGTNTFNTTLPTSTISASSPNQFTIKSFTDATYATIASLGSYLTTSTAAATYATIASLGSYLTTATASTTYLTITAASSTYQTIANMTNYLTTATASTTYQTIANMTNYVNTTTGQNIGGDKTFLNYVKTKQGLWLYDVTYPYTNFMELSLTGTVMQIVPSFYSNSYEIFTKDGAGNDFVPITINNASTTIDNQLICNDGAVFNNSLPTSTLTPSTPTQLTTKTYVDSTFHQIIVGSIIQMAAGVVPSGYLECNGASVTNSTYPALFNVIGYTYGGTYPSATFSLPDFRGIFLRGKGTNGIDSTYASSTNYGFLQTDGIKSHTHDILFGYNQTVQGSGGSFNAYSSTSPNYNNPGTGLGRATGLTSNNANPYPDTRPGNYAVLFCIKY